MADFNDPFAGTGMKFVPTLAAFAGAILSLRSVNDIAPWARMVSVCSSFCFSFLTAPYAAEYLNLSDRGLVAVALLLGLFGIHLVALGFKILDNLKSDPKGFISWAFDLWRGRSGS